MGLPFKLLPRESLSLQLFQLYFPVLVSGVVVAGGGTDAFCVVLIKAQS